MESGFWILHQQGTDVEFRITKPTFNVGRNNGTDITCKTGQVSRKHAILMEYPNGKLFVQDNKSLNGTYVNRVQIQPYRLQELYENDELGFGLHSRTIVELPNSIKYVFTVKKDCPVTVVNSDSNTVQKIPTQENSNVEVPIPNQYLTSQELLNILDSQDMDIPNIKLESNGIENSVASVQERVNGRLVVNVADKQKNTNVQMRVKQEPAYRYGIIEPQPSCSYNIKEQPPDLNMIINQAPSNTSEGYTIEDGCVIIHDGDDEDDDKFPCSQLLNDDCTAKNGRGISDSIFCAIKMELEQLDQPVDERAYAVIDLNDSDLEDEDLDWIDNIQKQTESKIKNKNSVLCTNDNLPEPEYNVSKKHCASMKKYVKPPVIPPHVELQAKSRRVEAIVEKRKTIEKENEPTKRIKPNNFYNLKDNKDSSCNKRKGTESLTKETKEIIQEIRKQKLKVLAKKLPGEKEQKSSRPSTAATKIKVSSSRSAFLIDNSLNTPSTSTGKTTVPNVKRRNSSGKLDSTSNFVSNNSNIASNRRESTSLLPKSTISVQQVNATQIEHNRRLPKIICGIEDILMHILHWNTLWFFDQEDNKRPPLTSEPLSRMSKSFTSYSDYYKTVRPLLEYELWNFISKEAFTYNSDLRRRAFLTQIENETKMSNYTELECFTYITKEQNENSYYLKEEDILVLEIYYTRGNETVKMGLLSYVIEVRKKLLKANEYIDGTFARATSIKPHAVVFYKLIIKSYQGDKLQVDRYIRSRVLASLVPSSRVIKSVKYLEHSLLCSHILKPSLEQYKLPTTIPQAKLFSQDNLNIIQHQAVMEATYICLRKEPGIYLIQGPPGTGKSTVIINIIQQILFRGIKQKNANPSCILVVAPSNGAVDELVLRLIELKSKFEAEYRKGLKLVRMGPKNMINPGVQDYSLYEIAKRNLSNDLLNTLPKKKYPKVFELHRNIAILKENCNTPDDELKLNALKLEFDRTCRNIVGRAYNENMKKTEETVLSRARIICTTLSSCIGIRMEEVFGGSNNKINCCIVDEATQSTEQETLIPLKLGINKMVLVGDPKQLPAMTQSVEARNCAYGLSLFSRILHNFEGKPTNPIKMLTDQYRMHPTICDFPSRTFYDGKLRTSAIVRKRRSQLSILKPYLLFCFKLEMVNSQEYQNQTEVFCVLKLLDAIIQNLTITSSFTIGIITPYNCQKDAIKNTIKHRTFRSNISIAVNTVDSFQGQEKDVIILSCVRQQANGFVSDEHRLNVAITRAKHVLYVIGSDNLFQTCQVLGKMYDDAKRRQLMKNVHPATKTLTFSKFIKV